MTHWVFKEIDEIGAVFFPSGVELDEPVGVFPADDGFHQSVEAFQCGPHGGALPDTAIGRFCLSRRT